MLYDAKGFKKIYIRPGYTDMRKGIDGLKIIIANNLDLNPYEKNVLYLFCGRNKSRIRGLVWEGDGFLILQKRLEDGRYIWPQNEEAVLDLTQDQFDRLMTGFSIESSIKEVNPKSAY